MADRRRQIILLLATRYDGLYLPAGALTTRSGLAPGATRPCPTCGHTQTPGWVIDAFKRRTPCTACGGATTPSGKHGDWLRKDAGKGRVAFDPMDALETAVGSTGTFATARPRKTVKCDGCGGDGAHGNGQRCEVCGGHGRRDQHLFDLHIDHAPAAADPLAAAIDARDQAGSYHDLDLALAGIRVHANKPLQYALLTPNATEALRLLDEVYLPPAGRSYEALNLWEQQLVDLALAYIDTRMPDPIRVPADAIHNQRELEQRRTRAKGRMSHPAALAQRNHEIRKLHRKGQPVQWIAQEYQLSVSSVYEILNAA